MSKKIVFFDIDGTLLNGAKEILPSTKEAIEILRKNDVEVVIATGRPPFMFDDVRRELQIDSYVSFNGQHVVYQGEVIHQSPLKREQVIALHEDATKAQFPMIYFSETAMRATVDGHKHVKSGLGQLKFYYPEIDIEFPHREKIYQALMFCETGREDILTGRHSHFHFLRWHPYSIDILPAGGTKAIGIQQIINASGLKMENSYAFGDGLNDLEMLKMVGTGVAMGNARETVKNIADYVTDDAEVDGIFNGLKYLELI